MTTQPNVPLSDGGTGDPGCLTYESFFGLREKPFSLSPNPRFFFRTASHSAAFSELLAGIRRREGILALTGEVGTGKTTLCRTVLQSLDRKTFAAYVPDPIMTREDLLKTLLVDFGVVSVEEIRAGHLRGASRTELSYPLYEFLSSLQPLHAFAVVMIDEAQNVPAALLEEIRILSDLEHGQRLLQLLLVGQPELKSRFAGPDMRQLTQRLSVRAELTPLARPDVAAYIAHRLAIAGSTKVSFTDEATSLISAASGGVPRVINLLSDRALFHAARGSSTKVTRDHVTAGADDLKIPRFRLDAWFWDPADAQKPDAHREEVPGVSAPAAEVPIVRETPVAPRAPRQGLPATYQMRHDAHYVDELESIRQSIAAAAEKDEPADKPRPGITPAAAASTAIAPAVTPVSAFPSEVASASAPSALAAAADSVAETSNEIAQVVKAAARLTPTHVSFNAMSSQSDPYSRETLTELTRFKRLEPPDLDPPAIEEVDIFGDEARARQKKQMTMAAVAIVVLAIGAGGIWRWRSAPTILRPVSARTQPAADVPETAASAGAKSAGASDAVTSRGAATTAPTSVDTSTPTATTMPPLAIQPLTPAGTRFIVQMATFLSPERAVESTQDFQAAGLNARSVSVSLRDGRQAFAVVLGPYPERALAEQALTRAQQIPGYDTGKIVQTGLTASTAPAADDSAKQQN